MKEYKSYALYVETMVAGERELGLCNGRVADVDKTEQGPTEGMLRSRRMGKRVRGVVVSLWYKVVTNQISNKYGVNRR